MNENNKVNVIGKIDGTFEVSHEVKGEMFYEATLSVERLSGAYDDLPIIVSEDFIDLREDYKDRYVNVVGELRTRNQQENGNSRLMVYLFVKDICFVDAAPQNTITLDGYICKPPVYRETPFGKKITDLIIAVNRPNRKADYIPCVCWYQNAKIASSLEVGEHIKISGRIQSRKYVKRISDMESEDRVAYEVSIDNLSVIYEKTVCDVDFEELVSNQHHNDENKSADYGFCLAA